MKQLARVFATVAVLLAWASGAAAQTNTGQIGGVVKDATGGVLPEATVRAKHPATGLTATRVTDEQGRFFFPSMQTGLWDITITLPAFATQTRSGVSLELGRTLDLEFTLAVAGVVQQISVDAGDVQLQTTTAEISDVIENREAVQIPLNGRNFLALARFHCPDGCAVHGKSRRRPGQYRRRARAAAESTQEPESAWWQANPGPLVRYSRLNLASRVYFRRCVTK